MEADQEQPSTPERKIIKKHGDTSSSNSIDRDISGDRLPMKKQSIEANTVNRQYATPSPPRKLTETGIYNNDMQQRREEQLLHPPRKEKKKPSLRLDPLLDKHIARKLNFNLDEQYNFNLASYSRSFHNGIIPQQSFSLAFESQSTQSSSLQQQTVQNTPLIPANNQINSNNLFTNRYVNYHPSNIDARNTSSSNFSNINSRNTNTVNNNNSNILNQQLQQQTQNTTSFVNNSSSTTSNQQPPQSILKFR